MDLDDGTFGILHELRLRGLVEIPDGPVVDALIEAGLAARTRNLIRLTPKGREAHGARATLESGSTVAAAVNRGYEMFLPLNVEFLQLCSDWQVRPGGVPNDHTDPRYDWNVLDRLRRLDERSAPVVRRLGAALDRFTPYRPRFRSALERLDNGEHEWFTSPRCDSYHTVWMQLHEDLLIALGKERVQELQP